MNTEPTTFNVQPIGKAIATAFVKAQADFGPALKTSDNPHFRSKYAGLDACIEAVVDALHDNGIALLQRTLPCESGVAVETILLHSSGETISGGVLHVPAQKQDPQGYGSALTYARRYSLLTTCGIAPENDDDGNAASKPTSYAKPAQPAPRTKDESFDPIIRSNKPRANGKAPVAVTNSADDDEIPF